MAAACGPMAAISCRPSSSLQVPVWCCSNSAWRARQPSPNGLQIRCPRVRRWLWRAPASISPRTKNCAWRVMLRVWRCRPKTIWSLRYGQTDRHAQAPVCSTSRSSLRVALANRNWLMCVGNWCRVAPKDCSSAHCPMWPGYSICAAQMCPIAHCSKHTYCSSSSAAACALTSQSCPRP